MENQTTQENVATFCSYCDERVNLDDYEYTASRHQTWDDPEEGYYTTPCCNQQLDFPDVYESDDIQE